MHLENEGLLRLRRQAPWLIVLRPTYYFYVTSFYSYLFDFVIAILEVSLGSLYAHAITLLSFNTLSLLLSVITFSHVIYCYLTSLVASCQSEMLFVFHMFDFRGHQGSFVSARWWSMGSRCWNVQGFTGSYVMSSTFGQSTFGQSQLAALFLIGIAVSRL